jgi:hypothetical protein
MCLPVPFALTSHGESVPHRSDYSSARKSDVQKLGLPSKRATEISTAGSIPFCPDQDLIPQIYSRRSSLGYLGNQTCYRTN